MKVLLIIALCIIIPFTMLGYSQFKTTPIEEIAQYHNDFGKIVIVRGYIIGDGSLFLVEDLDVYRRNCPMRYEEYILLKNLPKFMMSIKKSYTSGLTVYYPYISSIKRVKGIVFDYWAKYEGVGLTVIQPALYIIQIREAFSANQYENIRRY